MSGFHYQRRTRQSYVEPCFQFNQLSQLVPGFPLSMILFYPSLLMRSRNDRTCPSSEIFPKRQIQSNNAIRQFLGTRVAIPKHANRRVSIHFSIPRCIRHAVKRTKLHRPEKRGCINDDRATAFQ